MTVTLPESVWSDRMAFTEYLILVPTELLLIESVKEICFEVRPQLTDGVLILTASSG
jgi:hypothetical protein